MVSRSPGPFAGGMPTGAALGGSWRFQAKAREIIRFHGIWGLREAGLIGPVPGPGAGDLPELQAVEESGPERLSGIRNGSCPEHGHPLRRSFKADGCGVLGAFGNTGLGIAQNVGRRLG